MSRALKFYSEFKASTWVRAVSTLSFSALVAQSLILLATPILSRLYNPEDFAALALFMAIYLIVGVAANLKYDQAIMLPMLEMAGDKTRYIPEILHVYNNINPLHHSGEKERRQYETMLRIRKKSPYKRRF